ncbi:MAG TPA: hypothetical protein VNH64_10995 [Parvularculaceae bacterium]|nr:hypothetical protein [Parvularculaceae bacterium]
MLSDIGMLFEPPAVVAPPTDRRLTRRFVDIWMMRARGGFPSWAEISNAHLGDDRNWLFAVDLARSAGFPYFIFLGDHLAKLSDVYLCGDTDWTLTLLDKAVGDIEACIEARAPRLREDEITLCDGRRILFRSVAAPLADDGERFTHVAGVVNGKFAD